MEEAQAEDETEVKSVKAINQTIASETSEEITFEVNGKEYTLAEFNKAFEGYTVEFFTNNKDISITDGKVTATADFKYAVQVTDEAGNKVPAEKPLAKDFADVKVEDAKVATKIHSIGLVQGDKEWDNPTITAADEGVKIVATEFENALGDKNTDVKEDGKTPTEKAAAIVAPEVKTAVSSDPKVAYYDTETGVIVRNKDGKVTFTVTFEGDQFKGQEFKLDVTAKAEQKATSIEAKDLKVKADEGQTFDIKVLDQDGEEMRTETELFYTSTATGKPEAAEATKVEGEVKFAAGNHVVNIYADAEKKTKLGSFKVEAVDVSEDAEIEEYKFVVADGSKDEEGNVKPLDLNKEVSNKELNLDVKAFIEDIEVDLNQDVELKVDSSDKEVATVKYDKGVATVTAVKVGKATITLYTVEGDMKTPVATYEVEVTDSTKPVETLTLKDNTKVIVTGEDDEDLAAAVQAAVKEENIADKIAKVEPVEANGIVIVIMKEEYGGGEYVLDAVYDFAKLEGAVITAKVDGEKGTDAEKATVTEQGITFTAVAEGEEGNDIEIEFVAETEVGNDEVTKTKAEVSEDNKKVKVTLAQEAGTAASDEEPTSEGTVGDITATKADVVAAVNALEDDSKIVTAALAEGTTGTETVTASGVIKTNGGKNATPEIKEQPATLTLTFDEAVTLDGDFALFTKGTEAQGGETVEDVKVTFAAKPILSEDGITITVELADEAEIAKDAVITKIDGVKAVKGIVLVRDETVTDAQPETTTP